MESVEKDGSYVRSIVAMMNDVDSGTPPLSPAWGSRKSPSYLNVSKSSNGYNTSLLYNDHRNDRLKDDLETFNINGSSKPADESRQYVSLSQMIGPKKTHSKYSDLGLKIKSPERNCRSFLRNISSFERIGKEAGGARSPEHSVTMVGQKMKHLLHLDSPASAADIQDSKGSLGKESGTTPHVTACLEKIKSPKKISEDVTDRAISSETPVEVISKQIEPGSDSKPTDITPALNTTEANGDSQSFKSENLSISSEKKIEVIFSKEVFTIVGLEEPEMKYDAPPTENPGLHYRGIAYASKEKLLHLSKLANDLLDEDINLSEEIQGLLRSASGKASLIVRERFRQFDDLCEENINPKGSMVPGPFDLAGFWDMVMIEVSSIYTQFRELAQAATDNWSMPEKSSQSNNSDTQRQNPKKTNKKGAARRVPSVEPRIRVQRPRR